MPYQGIPSRRRTINGGYWANDNGVPKEWAPEVGKIEDWYTQHAKPANMPAMPDLSGIMKGLQTPTKINIPKYKSFDMSKYEGMFGESNEEMSALLESLKGLNFDPEAYTEAMRPGMVRDMQLARGTSNMMLGNESGFRPGTGTPQQRLMDLAGEEYADNMNRVLAEAKEKASNLQLSKAGVIGKLLSDKNSNTLGLANLGMQANAAENDYGMDTASLLSQIAQGDKSALANAGDLGVNMGNMGLNMWESGNQANQQFLNTILALKQLAIQQGMTDEDRWLQWMNSQGSNTPSNPGQY